MVTWVTADLEALCTAHSLAKVYIYRGKKILVLDLTQYSVCITFNSSVTSSCS